MPRKSQFEKLLDDLTAAPWWVSMLIGLVALVVLFGLGGIARTFSPLVFLFFSIVAFFAFVNQERKTALLVQGHDFLRC